MRRIIGLNELHRRVGQDHHNAKLTNHDVDLIRDLRESYGLTYESIAEKFECSKSTVRDIVKCNRRAQYPVRFKEIGED